MTIIFKKINFRKNLGTFICSLFRLQMATFLSPKIPFKFYCENCDYFSNNKKDYTKHIETEKHKGLQNTTILPQKSPHDYSCECGKLYKHHSSLWKHKQKCPKKEECSKEEADLIKFLIKENSEFKNMILDVCKSMPTVTTNMLTNSNNQINNTNNINNNNKTFNLQFFLNETCKDAMNLTDFVNSLQIQLSDLENVGKIGFVKGISNIIVKNLKALDVTQRPVHCSDQKREVMYVKEQDQWSKEEPENQKLKKAIKQIVHKNICMIPQWKTKYPDCIYADSRKSDIYNHIVYESMDNNDANTEKIIKKIAKEVIIEKNDFSVK